ncbi:MAG: hypothetical protein P8Y63_09930 [Deltaproteobacteria bacterium]
MKLNVDIGIEIYIAAPRVNFFLSAVNVPMFCAISRLSAARLRLMAATSSE